MRLAASLLVALGVLVTATPGAAAPEGQMTWAVHISLAPSWFDPAETPGIATPFYSLSGAFGNAATRLENFVVAGGAYVYGSYPDIDGLLGEQAAELDRKRREAILHRIQQLVHDKAMYAPIWELGFIHAQGPRVAESGSASSPAGRSPPPTRT